MNPHVKRWITGAVAVPILFAIILYGPVWIFAALIIFASLAGVHEYNQMAFGKGPAAEKIQTLVIAFAILMAALSGDFRFILAVLSFAVMAVWMLALLRNRDREPETGSVARMILGLFYIPLLMSHFILIRKEPEGILWIFFILVLAFSGDIAAYYVGRTMGKRKLLPRVSPGKTVEGTIALVAGSVVGCLLFQQVFYPQLPLAHTVVLGLVGSIAGQLGDLCESALKRAAGVKDSGTLLPGHGGILDRLDCLMFITPFVYYYQALVIR